MIGGGRRCGGHGVGWWPPNDPPQSHRHPAGRREQGARRREVRAVGALPYAWATRATVELDQEGGALIWSSS